MSSSSPSVYVAVEPCSLNCDGREFSFQAGESIRVGDVPQGVLDSWIRDESVISSVSWDELTPLIEVEIRRRLIADAVRALRERRSKQQREQAKRQRDEQLRRNAAKLRDRDAAPREEVVDLEVGAPGRNDA